MKSCPNCNAPIGFGTVVKSLNPARLSCANCKARMPVKILPVLLLMAVVSLVSVAAVVALMPHKILMLLVLVAIGFAGEYVYFLLLKAGWLDPVKIR